jgi:hypothetical protein
VYYPAQLVLYFICSIKNIRTSWVLVAHACNPSYSEGRDQEDQGLKNFQSPFLKKKKKITHTHKKSQKRSGGVAQGSGPEFKPQYHKKKKNLAFLNDIIQCQISGHLTLNEFEYKNRESRRLLAQEM